MSTTGKWEELFGKGRKWRVAEELTGVSRDPARKAVLINFERGQFELPPGTAFRSPLSTNLGRRGVVLQETDDSGSSDIPGSRIAVGAAAVTKARKDYGAVW